MPIAFSKKSNKGNILQIYDVMASIMRVKKFQIDLKILKFTASEIFTDFDETKKSEEDDKDIDYDRVPSFVKLKLLLAIIIQVRCSIFSMSLVQRKVIIRWIEADNLRLEMHISANFFNMENDKK